MRVARASRAAGEYPARGFAWAANCRRRAPQARQRGYLHACNHRTGACRALEVIMTRSGIVLVLVLCAAPASAQEPSLVEGFAEGFTFNAIFSTSHRTDSEGAVVYNRNESDGARIAVVRQGADPCVFLSTSLNLNTGNAAPVVVLDETYDLRGVSFESNPKHEFAPPGGTYLIMKGPRVLCRLSTGGDRAKLAYLHQCQNELLVTIESRMMAAFERTAAKLKGLCKWK
jgi:hypothetical protein